MVAGRRSMSAAKELKMSDAGKTRKRNLGKTKEELVDELKAMERRLKKAEADGARRKQA